MATEPKTNGATVEYSPKKVELLNGSNGDEAKREKYTKKDQDGDEERVPLNAPVDVEKCVPVATLDIAEEDQDTRDCVSLKSEKKKKKKKTDKNPDTKGPIKGKWRQYP